MPPPYRIETERLVVRCWEPRDAPLLKDAVDSSLEHLRPWMPWAHEDPQPLEAKVELLRGFRGRFDLGQDFVYGIFSPDESEAVGGTGFHTRRGEGIFEIGYWIRASRVRRGPRAPRRRPRSRGSASRSARSSGSRSASTRPTRRAWRSRASSASSRRGRCAASSTARTGQPRASDAVVFALLRGEFERDVELKAFDAAGERVL